MIRPSTFSLYSKVQPSMTICPSFTEAFSSSISDTTQQLLAGISEVIETNSKLPASFRINFLVSSISNVCFTKLPRSREPFDEVMASVFSFVIVRTHEPALAFKITGVPAERLSPSLAIFTNKSATGVFSLKVVISYASTPSGSTTLKGKQTAA